MTPTEKAKRSDALYYETVSVNRRVLCDMIANREADLEDARAENEELWASNERMGLKAMAAIGEIQEENERLKADNAKLREWCSDFWKWADPPFALKSGTFDEYMALVERAVELGVIK